MEASEGTAAYNDAYPTCERTYAELRIYCGDILPARVTSLLNIEPTHLTIAGKEILSSATGRTRISKLNAWFLSSEPSIESKDLRRHLDWLLNQVYLQRKALLQLQAESGVRMQVTCIWWSADGNGGPVLSPTQMAKMGELNLDCDFELAFFGNEDD